VSVSLLEPQVLRGSFVALEPYSEGLKGEVREALNCDPDTWELFPSPGQGEHFDAWWANAVATRQAGTWISFAVRRLSDQRVVGSTSFLNIRPDKQTVEIGATFLHPDARGGAINPEAKRLMLAHAFDSGVRRVELLTDARNARSRAAIAKLGAAEEGTLRRERVMWTGHVRDSVLFSITDSDWPDVRDGLDIRPKELP
jgi:RimJ/RimL family protein N-acetyltransferase